MAGGVGLRRELRREAVLAHRHAPAAHELAARGADGTPGGDLGTDLCEPGALARRPGEKVAHQPTTHEHADATTREDHRHVDPGDAERVPFGVGLRRARHLVVEPLDHRCHRHTTDEKRIRGVRAHPDRSDTDRQQRHPRNLVASQSLAPDRISTQLPGGLSGQRDDERTRQRDLARAALTLAQESSGETGESRPIDGCGLEPAVARLTVSPAERRDHPAAVVDEEQTLELPFTQMLGEDLLDLRVDLRSCARVDLRPRQKSGQLRSLQRAEAVLDLHKLGVDSGANGIEGRLHVAAHLPEDLLPIRDGGGVAGGTERPRGEARPLWAEQAGGIVNPRRQQCFLWAQGRQNAGNSHSHL